MNTTTRWNRGERGAKERQQMRRYAADVLIASGRWDGISDIAICPLTDMPFNPFTSGEVDKANPAAGYVPGNVILTSVIGNRERGKLQQWRGDMNGASRYASDIAGWSMGIIPMRFCHLKNRAAIQGKTANGDPIGTCSESSNVRNGPYGK